MTPLLDFARSEPLAALAPAGALLILLAWLGWRRPTWLFLLALASLAIRPQLLWGGSEVGWEWGLHQTLLVLALAANALHYGLRKTVNWPILALLASFGLSLAFGNLHPKLTVPFMLMSLALLALPFAFIQVVLEPGSRRVCATVVALNPLFSVVAGGMLEASGTRQLFAFEPGEGAYRLEGATGNAAVFALLAFAGFAASLHETTRRARPYAPYLAALNLVLIVLSGSRTAMMASILLLATFLSVSDDFRSRCRSRPRLVALGAVLVLATILACWPWLQARFWGPDGLRLSARDELWSFYWREFLLSPIFGRGIGSGLVAGNDRLHFVLNTPHNEYLHMLVIGGAVGCALFLAGVVVWYRQILSVTSPNDRDFLIPLTPSLLSYALTDNLLLYPTSLALFAYATFPLTGPALFVKTVPGERGSAGSGRQSEPYPENTAHTV